MSRSGADGIGMIALVLAASLWTLPIGWTAGQHYCTSATVGTSSCTLPQNGCDGVLRGYGRCEEGTTTVTIPINSYLIATTVTFPTAFTNTPASGDVNLRTISGVAGINMMSALVPLFESGNTTWFNIPQSKWTELFASTAYESRGSTYSGGGDNQYALSIGCQNCTGFENFGLEWSSDQVTWHNLLNTTFTSISSGGTSNSGTSTFAIPAGGQPTLDAWYRVTVNNQVGASESIVFTHLAVVQIQGTFRLLNIIQTTLSKTQLGFTVYVIYRNSGTQAVNVEWQVNVATG